MKSWQLVGRLFQQLGELQCPGGAPIIKASAQRALQCDLWGLVPAFEGAC